MLEPHIPQIGIVPRLRKSPFYDATVRHGAKGFTVYNHMLMPTWYNSPEADYWKLMRSVTLWDVAAERQVEVRGADAFTLVRKLTPRDLSRFAVGQCRYAPITAEDGGIINDPLILRLADDHFWISLADSDVLLWVRGVALGLGLDVSVSEPDVSPLALQGPRADAIATALFGDWARALGFFRLRETALAGIPLVVARSGWSKQGGFELYLRDASRGDELWERIMHAGAAHDIAPATPSSIERIESGLLSYGNDMTLAENPLEVGLGKYCQLDQAFAFIGQAALQRIHAQGVKRTLVGLRMGAQRRTANAHWWPLRDESRARVGKVTSAVYSPRLQQFIGLALVSVANAHFGTRLWVDSPQGELEATVGPPFFD